MTPRPLCQCVASVRLPPAIVCVASWLCPFASSALLCALIAVVALQRSIHAFIPMAGWPSSLDASSGLLDLMDFPFGTEYRRLAGTGWIRLRELLITEW